MRQLVLAVFALLSATPALAWGTNEDPDSCSIFQTFDDNTSVIFLQSKRYFDAEAISFAVVNDSWSITKGQKLTGRLMLESDEDMIWNDKVTAFQDHGLLTALDEKWFLPLTQITVDSVTVSFAGKKLLTANWDGFWSSYRDFDECRKKKGWLAERQAKKDEADRITREKRYRRTVPVDPFATPPPKPPVATSKKKQH